MRNRLLFLSLIVSVSVTCVRSKPHSTQHELQKDSHLSLEKLGEQDSQADEENEGQDPILPTFLPIEASSQEEGEEEVVSFGEENKESGSPVLLSEDALAHLLQDSGEEAEEEQEDPVETTEEDEEEESTVKKITGAEEEDKGAAVDAEEEDVEVESQMEKLGGGEEEDSDSSTASEIPADLDYASDSDGSDIVKEATPVDGKDTLPEEERKGGKEEIQLKNSDEIPKDVTDYDPDTVEDDVTLHQSGEGKEGEGKSKDKTSAEDTLAKEEKTLNSKHLEVSDSSDLPHKAKVDIELRTVEGGGKQETHTNESGGQAKGKGRKHKKGQRKRKGQMQGDQPMPPALLSTPHRQPLGQKTPETTDNAVQRSKRRKSGKWAPMIGMNPVQIRATVELYPSLRPPQTLPGVEAENNLCENVRCKRGKVCKVHEDDKPVCVCQDAADCPHSVTEFDHVCGTDNKTYDTSCQLFATKCSLEGTKRGHRLHLDYTGACKFIPPCLSTELSQFPLRMRDWLKNVLLQLYEHDSMAPGFLTPKQRARVQKIYESERRLHAGDHPIELLAQDFEKNYHMYIYPVHWQFAQMDQHPTDRYLSHSELAPLRAPLVPMEHCTSDFFQECDADKDKQVSFKEWCHCFGIKDDDMDALLLF